jgi:hypothetical protein
MPMTRSRFAARLAPARKLVHWLRIPGDVQPKFPGESMKNSSGGLGIVGAVNTACLGSRVVAFRAYGLSSPGLTVDPAAQ